MTRRGLLMGLLSVTGVAAGIAVAQQRAVPNPQDKLALADVNVKELLLLMDADHNGRISKHEWMNFMEAEFNKLDRDGNGELDTKELLESKLSMRRTNSAEVVR
jgi:Ca2+-binding EF-hand superfamily protein